MIRRPIPLAALSGSVDFVRSELYFGTQKPDGVVTDEEFFAFLDRVITPRFPGWPHAAEGRRAVPGRRG